MKREFGDAPEWASPCKWAVDSAVHSGAAGAPGALQKEGTDRDWHGACGGSSKDCAVGLIIHVR